jgi:hypothetical protein
MYATINRDRALISQRTRSRMVTSSPAEISDPPEGIIAKKKAAALVRPRKSDG